MAGKTHSTRIILFALLIIGFGIVAAYFVPALFGGIGGDPSASLTGGIDQHLIERGAYVAIEGDCAACHTAPAGKAFAGGLALATPLGAVYSTNITPDKETGIGAYTYGDFERAVRRGIRPDGRSLYPAMPYPSYARISDDDVKALYAFFMKGVAPVRQAALKPDIPWPLSMRWPLTYWRWAFAPPVQPAAATAGSDPIAARGAYLVEGLGHCGSCHTPRGIGLEEKALKAGSNAYLSGAVVDHYLASDLRGGAWAGLGAWRESDIVQFLKTGRTRNSAAFGGMADVVFHSTQDMSDADLQAIAHFLKSLPSAADDRKFAYEPAVTAALHMGDVSKTGAIDYLNNCAACHTSSGKGYPLTFPALAGNPVVNAADPSSLIHIVLSGGTVPSTGSEPTAFTMPGFKNRLTDQEIADVLNFIRSSWGNDAAQVDAGQVANIRASLPMSNYAKAP